MSEPANACAEPERGRLLAAYELGLLPPAETLACEEHLGRCDACLEDLYAHAPHAVALTAEAPEVLASLRPAGRRASLPGRREAPAAARRPRGWDRRLAFPAAALAAAALLAVMLWRPQGAPEVASLAEVEPIAYVPLGLRGAGAGDPFERGMSHYAAGRYAAAAPDLEAAAAAGGSEPVRREQARFFLGLSLLLAGDPDAALPHLDAATESSQPVIADRARWYLAQLHLLRGAPEPALDLLDGLAAQSPGYGERAARLAAAVRARISRGESGGR